MSAQLFGNQLDLGIREHSRNKPSVPVGPDTSFLIAEVIASTIDHALQEGVGLLRGTRYIDDYHLILYPTLMLRRHWQSSTG